MGKPRIIKLQRDLVVQENRLPSSQEEASALHRLRAFGLCVEHTIFFFRGRLCSFEIGEITKEVQ